MRGRDVDGLNAGYASLLLDEYLENPEAVPAEWRALFESGERRARRRPSRPAAAARGARRRQRQRRRRSPAEPRRAAPRSRAEPPHGPRAAVDETLLGGVAAAMALVKAHRMHGHLAARLDPLGSEPLGRPGARRDAADPAADARAAGADPALAAAPPRPGRDARRGAARAAARSTAGRSPTRSSTSPTTSERVWLRQAIESGRYRQPLEPEERTALLERALRGSRASSSTCAARSSARSSSRSRGST